MIKRDRLAIMAAILAPRLNTYRCKDVVEEAWNLDVAIGRRMKKQADRMVGISASPHGVDAQAYCARFAGEFDGTHYGCDREKGHTGPHRSQTLDNLRSEASDDDD